ncbi:MAG: hypothetical protein HY718_04175, partial [Planctomycetes bacterium]|nr:hypothetical protein [Planctomycetota bacterium]
MTGIPAPLFGEVLALAWSSSRRTADGRLEFDGAAVIRAMVTARIARAEKVPEAPAGNGGGVSGLPAGMLADRGPVGPESSRALEDYRDTRAKLARLE